MVRCETCIAQPKVVRMFTTNPKLPPITRPEGTEKRGDVIRRHQQSLYHKEAVKAEKFASKRGLPDRIDETDAPPLFQFISKGKQALANRIGAFAITIYNDAKRLTLSAFSWPSREVSNQIGQAFDVNNPEQNAADVEKINLQYLNPTAHREIPECITEVESDVVRNKIENCISLSLRVDGSVDRCNLDKIYTIAKIVNVDGELENIFVGVGIQKTRKAEGLLLAVKTTINSNGDNLFPTCLKKMSSIVTDGASINKGERKGLWALIDREAAAVGATQKILKIWCAAHRSDSTFKGLKKNVKEVPEVMSWLTQVASLFHKSGMRTSELSAIADRNQIKLHKLPKYHEVRWTEYSYNLLNAILSSWQCLILYFQESKDHDGIAFRRFLTSYTKLRLIAFMADLLSVFQWFQKNLQSDDLTLISLKQEIDFFVGRIQDMRESHLIGGWCKKLEMEIEVKRANSANGRELIQRTWHGIRLTDNLDRRVNVTSRTCEVVHSEILEFVLKDTQARFSVETNLLNAIGKQLNNSLFVMFTKHQDLINL